MIIESVFSLYQEVHVLIVDDNSPDGTSSIVEDYQLRFSNRLF
ncbi:dolichol-phosphate mannosyltransferase [Nonlabens ulvanivorans]|nr:dolichol-phosphate mannosyltransferase [Nonlabens ulvanivorans]